MEEARRNSSDAARAVSKNETKTSYKHDVAGRSNDTRIFCDDTVGVLQ